MTTLNKYMYYILYCHWCLWSYEKFKSPLNKNPPGLMKNIQYTTRKRYCLPKPSNFNDAKMYWKGYTRHLVKEDFGEGFSQQHGVSIPAGSLNVQALGKARSTSHQIVTMSYLYIYNIARLYTNSRLCWIKEIPRTSEYFMSDFNLYLIKTSKLFTYLQIHVYIFYVL